MTSRSVGPLDVLHDDVAVARVLAEVVDADDVGMREAGGGARLVAEAREEGLVAGQVAAQDLDRHRAAEQRVFGAIDGRHAAFAQRYPGCGIAC